MMSLFYNPPLTNLQYLKLKNNILLILSQILYTRIGYKLINIFLVQTCSRISILITFQV